MATPVPDIVRLNNDHRRRRWIIRLCLLSLFTLLILTVAAFVLLSSPTGMTTSEAVAAFAQLKLEQTREDVERLLGKPVIEYKDTDANGNVGVMLTWQFYTPDVHGNFDHFQCTVRCNENGIAQARGSMRAVIRGWKNQLITRWVMLKRKLGI